MNKNWVRLIAAFVCFFSSLEICRAESDKKYEHPLQLPELFESRLAELGISQSGIDYLNAIDSCTHWSGEPAYDKERAKQINEGIKKSCGQIERHKQKFSVSKPAKSTQELVSKIAEDFKKGEVDIFSLDYFVWKDPEEKSQTMKSYYESRGETYGTGK